MQKEENVGARTRYPGWELKVSISLMTANSAMAMVDVNENDILVGEVYGSDVERSFAVKGMLEILERALKSVCMMFNDSLQLQLKAAKQPEQARYEGSKTVICNPRIIFVRLKRPQIWSKIGKFCKIWVNL